METCFILVVKMRNLSRNGSSQGIKLEEAKWQNNIYCFIEWNKIIRVEIYFSSLIIFLEGKKMLGYQP